MTNANGNSDPHAEQRRVDRFLNTLMSGHAEAALAMSEISFFIALANRGKKHPLAREKLRLAAAKFRKAAGYMVDAADRVP